MNTNILILFGVMLGVALCAAFSTDSEWSRGEAAAWVQAGGIFVALAIAIVVPSRIHKNESRERATEKLLQAQGIALLIRPSLIVLDGKLEREVGKLTRGAPPQDFTVIKVPTTIMGRLDLLWLMGSVGGHALQLVSTLDADNQTVADFKTLMAGNPNLRDINRQLNNRKRLLQAARSDAIDALAAIKTILDAKP